MVSTAKTNRKPGRPSGDIDLKPGILAAAEVAFASYGFDAASIRQIAHTANVSPAGVLHHYQTKRRLYAAVLARISDSLEAQPALANPAGPGEQALRLVVDTLVDWIVDNGLYARIILREIMENDERVQSARQWPLRDGMQAIYGAVRTALGAPPDDQLPELLSLQLLGAAFLFYTGQPTHRSQSAVSVDGWEENFRSLLIRTASCTIASTDASQRR